ncbi:DUF2784 domain-containing protein [Mucilaginibacter sp. L196]|uniref:DUF2784 domain-containing protein n=1 Tax=Mucilaginibacter sp. L196 TaxID=1641870 RepID=UPI00131AD944|nr:DUF2784 domain-containing protein [Mucilaginibacter sp. L196]
MIGLRILDLLLTLLHFVIIGFNLLGWIWKRTRKLHLIVVCVTAACWFILGIWFGIGYCPITDWDWQIKEKLGEHNLPDSFIKYYADIIVGRSVNASLIDTLTAAGFFIAALLAVYFNFIQKRVARN